MPNDSNNSFFLTQIDPRAAVKGSNDPLGFQPVWTRFGRKVIGDLTTVTRSVRNFTTLLLGLYFADDSVAAGTDEEDRRADYFLKFEQLAAYSRCAYGDEGRGASESPLGVLRVRARLQAGSPRSRTSAKRDHQILSNQRTYGIWGLYSVAASQGGLTERQGGRLSPPALEFVEREYLPRFHYRGNQRGQEMIKTLRAEESWFEPKGRHRSLGETLAGVLGNRLTASERRFYFGFQELKEIIKKVAAKKEPGLGEALEAVRAIGPVLAIAGRLFGYLLTRNGSTSDAAPPPRRFFGRDLRLI